MSILPEIESKEAYLPPDLQKRVDAERDAHENEHIHNEVWKWHRRFPHVFDNPAASRFSKTVEDELGAIGDGIIHHIDIDLGMTEVLRVLKPGGKAVFREPLGDNPLLKVYRAIAGFHTDDERPLGRADLKKLQTNFNAKLYFSGVLTAPMGVVSSVVWKGSPHNVLFRSVARFEQFLNRIPHVGPLNRAVAIIVTKGVS